MTAPNCRSVNSGPFIPGCVAATAAPAATQADQRNQSAHLLTVACATALLVLCAGGALAQICSGSTDPYLPTAAYADEVVSYEPVIIGDEPWLRYRHPENALGRNDNVPPDPCTSGCSFVTLGTGGRLTVRFSNNVLTGNGSPTCDLWIYEIGPDREATYVEISRNGQDWISLGRLVGNTDGIDIDAAGFGPSDYFWYVRVTDDPNSGGSSGSSAGADIDAIGALSSRTACELTDATPLQGLGAGDVITINGYGFSNGATVRFGNVPAAATTVVSSQVIRATVPGGVVGSFVVAVDLPDGTTCTLDSPAVNTESESWGYLKAMYR